MSGEPVEAAAFFVLAVLTVASALVVITHRNPIVCALALAFQIRSIGGSTNADAPTVTVDSAVASSVAMRVMSRPRAV